MKNKEAYKSGKDWENRRNKYYAYYKIDCASQWHVIFLKFKYGLRNNTYVCKYLVITYIETEM